MRVLSRLISGFKLLDISEFSLAARNCPFCGFSVFVKLNSNESGIRCIRCTASTVHLSMGFVLRNFSLDFSDIDVCEFSARGPFAEYLRRVSRSFSGSEYYEGVRPGRFVDCIRCEDLQYLTYADSSFDLVTHTEVMEHVADDARAFSELRRVLRPGGCMLFTVPLSGLACTIERARLLDGKIEHILDPIYHADPQRPESGILAFRDYGYDILDRLVTAGFVDCAILVPLHRIPWLRAHEVIYARRPCDDN